MRTYLRKILKKKLRGEDGESISEVLISMLIIELALLMVVSMIMSAGKMIRKSGQSFDLYFSRRNAMESNESETIKINGKDEPINAPVPTPGVVTAAETKGKLGDAAAPSDTNQADVNVYIAPYLSGSEKSVTALIRYEVNRNGGSTGTGGSSGEAAGGNGGTDGTGDAGGEAGSGGEVG